MGLLVAEIVDHVSARKRRAGRPERVVRARDQDLVAIVQERLHRQVDELGDAVSRIDVVHLDIRQALELVVLHDGLAGAEEAAALGVALALGELPAHIVDDLIGRPEAEGGGVADVELQDMGALILHAVGLVDDRAAHVVEHIVELVGLREFAHGTTFLGLVMFRGRCSCCILWLRDLILASQPRGRDAEGLGQEGEHLGAREGLPAHILAELALPELHARLVGHAYHIDLLQAAALHRLLQPPGECLVLRGCMGLHRQSSSGSSEVQFRKRQSSILSALVVQRIATIAQLHSAIN